jgi:subtilisin family serine protease
VIDTGIWPTHNDFKNPDGTSRANIFYDATLPVGDPRYGIDCNNHGTFVASTIGGNRLGIAKEATIYAVKVTPTNPAPPFGLCSGSPSTNFKVVEGINAVEGSALPQKVINISLGDNVDTAIDSAVAGAINTYGIPVIAAAGNQNRDDLNTGQKNRAQVLRDVVEFNTAVQQAYYNEAFVIMEYFGYLRRDADSLWENWLNTMNQNGGDYRVMIDGFMNSAEYRLRFGS